LVQNIRAQLKSVLIIINISSSHHQGLPFNSNRPSRLNSLLPPPVTHPSLTCRARQQSQPKKKKLLNNPTNHLEASLQARLPPSLPLKKKKKKPASSAATENDYKRSSPRIQTNH
jgi:hypothetical protein